MKAKDVRNYLSRLEKILKTLAREGRHIDFETRLEDYSKLLKAWLKVAPKGETPPERFLFLADLDRFGGPLEIDLRDIAVATTLSEDTSTIVAFADHLIKSAYVCRTHHQPHLMEEYLKTLVYFYYRCVANEDLEKSLSSRLDNGLDMLYASIRSLRQERSSEDAMIAEEEKSFFMYCYVFLSL